MKLRDAKEQVEREQPHLTGTAKLEAIKALRSQPKSVEPESKRPATGTAEAQDVKPVRKPTSIGEAWGFLAFVVIGMQLIPWIVWESPMKTPHWYDVLHAVLLIAAVAGLVSAYRKRSS